MEAIEAVVALTKERDEILDDLEVYESWFETLVGRHVTIAHKSKKKTKFVEAKVDEFNEGEGWTATDIETDEVYAFAFEDIVEGRVTFS